MAAGSKSRAYGREIDNNGYTGIRSGYGFGKYLNCYVILASPQKMTNQGGLYEGRFEDNSKSSVLSLKDNTKPAESPLILKF